MIPDFVTKFILRRIRDKDQSREVDGQPNTSRGPDTGKQASVREATFADFAAISAMNSRLGQGPDSPENWHRLWRDNPAIRSFNAPSRIGWVLEAAGRIVGFLGTIPLLYEFSGTQLTAAATCRLAVEPEFRAYTYLLVMAFFRQRDVQVFVDSSATPAAGKIMAAAKARTLPQRSFETVLFWVLSPRRYSAYALRKMRFNSVAVFLGSSLGHLALSTANAFRNKRPSSPSNELVVQEETLSSLDDRFDRFVDASAVRKTKMMAKRSAEILRWHFEAPQSRRPVTVLICLRNGEIRGYLVLRFYEESNEGLKRSVVADLLVRDNDQAITAALLRAALHKAKQAPADILEIAGFPDEIRDSLLRYRPYSRSLPANPFYFKAREKSLDDALQSPAAWYACAYDGDSTLWP